MAAASVVILACGNPSRGDDALGPELMQGLRERLSPLPAHLELVEDFQLQVEHALDLVGRDLVLFVDADASCAPPFRLVRVGPQADYSYSTHAMHPQAVLQVYAQTQSAPLPPAFLLKIRGESFELGEPLSRVAATHLRTALETVLGLCAHPDLGYWENRQTLDG